MVPDGLYYSKEHEWISVEGNTATIGITDHAQQELGDIVFVELPEVASTFASGAEFGTVESVKAVSEIYMPVSGAVIAVNESLRDAPETINGDPHGEGWIVKVRLSDRSELKTLMDAAAYRSYVGEA